MDAQHGRRATELLQDARWYRLRYQRIGVVALGAAGQGAVAMGDGVCWIEFDAFGEIGNRAVVVALGAVRVAAVVIGDDVLRIERDGLGVLGNHTVVVTVIVIGIATVVLGAGLVTLGKGHTRHQQNEQRDKHCLDMGATLDLIISLLARPAARSLSTASY